MRRGVPTVSKLWGSNTAILVGDYIFAKSATLVCETHNVRVIKRFAETIMELSSGQLNELTRAHKWPQTEDQYLDCISLKTASLFETASETGAVLSGADEKLIDAFKRYGRNIGIAFQIIDDMLDIYSSENETGKPTGQDLEHGIITLPSLLAINKSAGNNPIENMLKNEKDENLVSESIQFVKDQNVADECYQIAMNYCDNALSALNLLKSNRYKESLVKLVAYVVNRWQ
jgi:heptaprenyl diphosphate synthase/octaprenyl-diphosphate synthase